MNPRSPSHTRNRKLAAHASDAPSLRQRIADMEKRLAVERSQAVAHTREFGGSVKRRLTSPTSLIFTCAMGFIAAEIMSARRASAKAASKRGDAPRSKSKLVSLQSMTKPLMALVHLGSMGFLVKQGKESSETAQAAVSSAPQSPALH